MLPLRMLFALLLTVGTVAAQEAIELKPQWVVGKRYTHDNTIEHEATASILGQKINQEVTLKFRTVISVSQDGDPALKRLTLKIARFAFSSKMGGQQFGFDSENLEDNHFLKKRAPDLMKKDVTLIVTGEGAVKKIEGGEELLGQVNSAGAVYAGISATSTREAFGELVGHYHLRNTPRQPVKPGDSWPLKLLVDLDGAAEVAIMGTYTFKGMAERGGAQCAQIVDEGKLEVDVKPRASAGAAAEQLALIFENGKLSGTTWFDPQLGLPRELETVQEFTLKSPNGGGPGEFLVMPMKQKITTTLVSVEDIR